MSWPEYAQLMIGGGLFVVTAAYAIANCRMLGEMKEARIQELRPIVIFECKLDRPHLYLVVRNIGRGPAQKVRFDFQQVLTRKNGVELTQYQPFSQGIAFIAPQQEFTHWYGVTRDLGKREKEGEILTCNGQLEYEAVYFKRHYSEPFSLDLSSYKHLHDNPLANMGPPVPPTRYT